MKLIGLTGLAGSGKDTAAKLLIEMIPNTRKMALADSLKDITSMLFGWPRELLEGGTFESRHFREQEDTYWSTALDYKLTPRLALQRIGTECFRNVFSDDFWALVLQKKLKDFVDTDETIIVTDVRFPNEIDMIKSLGGRVYRIKRGEFPTWWEDAKKYNLSNKKELPKSLENIHISERALVGLNKETAIIDNNGTIEQLKQTLKDMFINDLEKPNKYGISLGDSVYFVKDNLKTLSKVVMFFEDSDKFTIKTQNNELLEVSYNDLKKVIS